ncbi:hypothetical protein [Aquimarina rubra]|uniref:Uncharacterized protein n=1 Tax=Aquimarina rubra TaxID=1920033 RepID=A0ABW5LH34_9FLAO
MISLVSFLLFNRKEDSEDIPDTNQELTLNTSNIYIEKWNINRNNSKAASVADVQSTPGQTIRVKF